jgi:hypothetical protein
MLVLWNIGSTQEYSRQKGVTCSNVSRKLRGRQRTALRRTLAVMDVIRHEGVGSTVSAPRPNRRVPSSRRLPVVVVNHTQHDFECSVRNECRPNPVVNQPIGHAPDAVFLRLSHQNFTAREAPAFARCLVGPQKRVAVMHPRLHARIRTLNVVLPGLQRLRRQVRCA